MFLKFSLFKLSVIGWVLCKFVDLGLSDYMNFN